MNILLQSAANSAARKNFENTITSGVALSYLKEYLSKEELQRLQLLGNNPIQLWGFTTNSKGVVPKTWTNLVESEDTVLFYGSKAFYFFGMVHLKLRNKRLAKSLWGVNEKGKTWEYLYVLRNTKPINIPYHPEILGYGKKHAIQPSLLLSGVKARAMQQYLYQYIPDNIEEIPVELTKKEETAVRKTIRLPKTPEEVQREGIRLSKKMSNRPVRERIVVATVLIRDPYVARIVKERARYICEICGALPFLKKNGELYAEAHHVEELAKKRIDSPHIMMCVCPTCHRVIHYGSDKALEERKIIKSRKTGK